MSKLQIDAIDARAVLLFLLYSFRKIKNTQLDMEDQNNKNFQFEYRDEVSDSVKFHFLNDLEGLDGFNSSGKEVD